ncbi:MAG TPA: sugar ABC transporter ATP-binding protein [Vicinamibacterales bacterium]|nr:sugar ABC transporter ATP-binding protein [Vicinamibacterales bacterium]
MSYLLQLEGVSKAFAGVQALRGVSFSLRAAEVHALVGENGAGKSTLIKVITGAESHDTGSLTLDGRLVPRMDPVTARRLGIAAIYQHPMLFPALTVAENIALPLDGRLAWRRVDWRACRERSVELLEQVGASIDPNRLVETLSVPERQLVEIVKAINANARMLIMDEPTASLTLQEVDRLLEVVRRLRARGTGIVYISHKLEEVFALADRITVLRDGESIVTRERDEIDQAQLVHLMVGRKLATVRPERKGSSGARGGDVAIELRGLSNRERGLGAVSLAVHRGEILGMAGLVGSGRTELAETLFGLTPPDRKDAGEIVVNGAAVRISCPAEAIRLGIAYVPEDRLRHGVIAEMSIAANTTLSGLTKRSALGLVDIKAEQRVAGRFVDQLRIKTPSVDADVAALSGGNQQKVALARWMSMEPSILILDEPTQGIDIGTKAEIHELIERLADWGVAIVLISSEMPELLALSDRIAVMRRGNLVGILERHEATPQSVMALALGHAA